MHDQKDWSQIAREIRACALGIKTKIREAKSMGLKVTLDEEDFKVFVFNENEKEDGISIVKEF
jgi:predicted peroxiredoxin